MDNKQFEAYNNIPAEKFQLANKSVTHDVKFDTKPIGYFRDAMHRFAKNKASVVAAVIILLIVVFAILTPLCNTRYDASFMDAYYQRLGPRNKALSKIGIATGGVDRTVNDRKYLHVLSMGIAAEDTLGQGVEWEKGRESDYDILLSVKDEYDFAGTHYRTVSVDSYLEKGFIYFQFTPQEYDKIIAWEQETGIKVIYPMVAFDNEYCFDAADANYWYKTDAKFNPIITGDQYANVYQDADHEYKMEDNYLRDAEGNVLFYKEVGGSSTTESQRKARVLYYNYYIYKNGFEPEYLFGTDSQGYDLSLRLAQGIQLSLLIAVAVSAINLFLGTIYGAIEGYFGGVTDLILERISDILNGVPFIVVATLFQMHLASKAGPIPSLLFAFVLTGWIGTASRVRTQFYRFKNQEYVLAARTLGAKNMRIMFKHIFPNSLGTIITSSVLVIPSVIFSESMLSYLGIINLGGVTGTSLGTLLSDASSIWTNYPHLMLFPALVVSLLMISFNLFGNGLRDAFNPSLRGVEE